ncbi:(2Fe-2S)-binding protein [Myceligenerans crystallogenes]|uniref:(2Fe-2S)-binding protein n=1 Tax=Myceligenerans crystallogenes TaxID=316335 RepID=A0ABP4ZQB7_9MICO
MSTDTTGTHSPAPAPPRPASDGTGPATVAYAPTVNGVGRPLRREPRRLLVDVLRDDFDVTTAATSCSDGVCGTCTVLLDDKPVRACLTLGHEADGRTVRTAESILAGPLGTGLSEAFSRHHAIQCGFCTPGFMVLAAEMIESGRSVSDDDLLDIVSDNLCRCTGYGQIIAAFRDIARGHGLWRNEGGTA